MECGGVPGGGEGEGECVCGWDLQGGRARVGWLGGWVVGWLAGWDPHHSL